MAKEKMTLEHCLQKTSHHASDTIVEAIMLAGRGPEDFKYRFKVIRENMEAALKQIEKIRKAAERAKCKQVLALLDEKTVEAGHEH